MSSLRCLHIPLQNLTTVGGALIPLLRISMLSTTILLLLPMRSPLFYGLLGKDVDAWIRTDDVVSKHLEKILVSLAERALFVLESALSWFASFGLGIFHTLAIFESSLPATVEAVDCYCVEVSTDQKASVALVAD